MTTRHVAALSLLSWYFLMVPPLKSGVDDARAPLSNWTIFSPYKSRSECAGDRSGWLQASIEEHNTGRVRAFRLSKCIASDNPRLKGNEDILNAGSGNL
jgi:hypothetical protein